MENTLKEQIKATYPYTFDDYQVRVEFEKYSVNNANAIALYSWNPKTYNEEPLLVASVNLEHMEVDDDEVIIKNYSENAGVLQFLIKNGFIDSPYEKIDLGYVKVHLCQIMKEL